MITDLIMPDVEGLSLIRDVRKNYPEVRIIAVSAADEYLLNAELMGARQTLMKPIGPGTLVRAVADVLGMD